MVSECAVAAVMGLALAHVAPSAVVRWLGVVGIKVRFVAGLATLADRDSRISFRSMRIVAGPAPKFLTALLGAETERQLFDVAHHLEAALGVLSNGGPYEDGPEFFQATARLERSKCLAGVQDSG